jgi:tRNA pseudouridine38-40 synthase
MTTWRLRLEYDGTDYCGWQRQPRGTSIQALVEEALEQVLGGERVPVYASGRTDAGVHALGQVASFTASVPRSPGAIRMGLNSLLPRDIACRAADVVPEGFHACHSAISKHYRYRILDTGERAPLRERFTLYRRGPLDLERMREAAASLLGEHDFACFQASQADTRTTVRTLLRADLCRVDDEIHLDIEGTGFLRHMVRIIVGTLLQVGRGQKAPELIGELICRGDRRLAGPTAPACGLCLIDVHYPMDLETWDSPRGQACPRPVVRGTGPR